MEPVIDITLPSPTTPQTFWSIVGPRTIMAIAFVTLILPETAEFYINLKTRNAQYPRQRIRVTLRHTRWRPYIPNPFAENRRHYRGYVVANPRRRAMG